MVLKVDDGAIAMDVRGGIDLETFGHEVAERLLGFGKVRGVRVSKLADMDDGFAYVFAIVTDRGSDGRSRAEVQTTLAFDLIDGLAERGDPHFAMVEFSTFDEWMSAQRA